MAKDGLIGRDADPAWLIDTTSIVAAAETYLLITRITGYDLAVRTLAALLVAPRRLDNV